MTLPRLALITPRFWPLVDETENLLAELAAYWAAQNNQTIIVTGQLSPHWPKQIICQGLQVVRLPCPPGAFGQWRYRRALRRWLSEHTAKFDLVYVSGLRQHAATAVETGRRMGFPVVVRAESAGLAGDCFWQLEAAGGARLKRILYGAAALVAPSRVIERELIAAGYPRQRIHYLPNGVSDIQTHGSEARNTARASLAEDHIWLELPPTAPLVLAIGALTEAQSLEDLIEAWPEVLMHSPNARLWMVGEGPQRAKLLAKLEALGISSWVMLPGSFDEFDDLLAAADLFVAPASEAGMPPALLQAMAASLPIIATDIPAHRQLLTDCQHALLLVSPNAQAWAQAIIDLLAQPTRAEQLGQAAADRVRRSFALDQTARLHQELFAKVLQALPTQAC